MNTHPAFAAYDSHVDAYEAQLAYEQSIEQVLDELEAELEAACVDSDLPAFATSRFEVFNLSAVHHYVPSGSWSVYDTLTDSYFLIGFGSRVEAQNFADHCEGIEPRSCDWVQNATDVL